MSNDDRQNSSSLKVKNGNKGSQNQENMDIVKKIKVVNKNERNVLDPSINKGHQLTQFSWFGHLMGWNHSIDF